jgi:hypothetical protein
VRGLRAAESVRVRAQRDSYLRAVLCCPSAGPSDAEGDVSEPCGYCGKDPCSAGADMDALLAQLEADALLLPVPVPRSRAEPVRHERQPWPRVKWCSHGYPLETCFLEGGRKL